MPRPLIKHVKGMSIPEYSHGYMGSDYEALSPFQRESIERFGVSLQMENDIYLLQHPEVSAMLNIIVARLTRNIGKEEKVKDLALHLIRPAAELDKEIRKNKKLPPEGPYRAKDAKFWHIDETDLYEDLLYIAKKHYGTTELLLHSPEHSPPMTPSSSFVSGVTSASTLATPEPEPERPPTFAELVYQMVSNTVDKATFLKVTDEILKYDTAYVELMKIVEIAMEIPVIEIRKDIAEMLDMAYKSFEYNILEKERIEADIAWDKRMRKKLKRLLRRQKNFKGYETPPSTSDISSHPSYKKPAPRPCKCQPQWTFNRYPKDRYGIYLASGKHFDDNSVSAPIDFSETDEDHKTGDKKPDSSTDKK